MSEPKEPSPAKLIVGLLYREESLQREALARLAERFGPLDFLSEPRPFTYTRYYEKEMGSDLLRQTGSFLTPVHSGRLPDIKLYSNRMEQEYSRDGKRRINIDPGLLSAERLVLATGKNYTHRIYLRDGVYADLTLIYQGGDFQAFPWTYPDYLDPTLLHFLRTLRLKLRSQLSGGFPVSL
ncbi:MAG: DUF4416 family protein [Syntrophobacteraceae bacterium]